MKLKNSSLKLLTAILSLSFFLMPALAVLTTAAGAETARKNVIASFYPLYVHAINIAGDKLKVDVLLPPGAGIHDFNCKPSDIKKISDAGLLLLNGAGLDDFALKIAENYRHAGLKTADVSYGVELISAAGGEACAGHDHGNAHEGHAALSDPHTWLSLKNAAVQVNNIAGALSGIDPENAPYYRANADAYLIKLAELDKAAAEKLSPHKGLKFIVFHGSFAYLARDYGMVQDSIADSFGNAPKPSKIKAIYDIIKKENIKFLVSEPGFQNKEIRALCEQYVLDNIELDPMGSYAPAPENARDHYIRTMKNNIEKLSAAFEKTAAVNK
jgi:zinc/manganese transport system substrate-binding protein